MKKIGLLGESIQHSISPTLHAAAFNSLNLEHEYTVWDINNNSLQSFIDEIQHKSIDGFNITIPHKQSIMKYIDIIDPVAESIGAVNTVINENGLLKGYNTDLYGIKKTFELLGEDLIGKNIVLIGAGGAAKSIVYYLNSINIGSLSVINRSIDRAKELIKDNKHDNIISIYGFDKEASNIITNSDIVINATPYGMVGSPVANQLPPIDFHLSKKHLVFDLVYNPTMTPLLQLIKDAGGRYIGGLHMLVYQAAKAFEIWNDLIPNIEAMIDAGQKALKKEN
tara:strand:+ start:1700 stop:2542 length:843 start_codon:yes stop_codon:yes gene_type:complete